MSRPNYYILLDLDPNTDDIEEIEKVIMQKRTEWSRLRNHPRRANEALANLDAIKGALDVLSNPEQRASESDQAREIINAEKVKQLKATYQLLDETISICSAKGWIEEAELKEMVESFSLNENEIRARISLPIESRHTKKPKDKRAKINTSDAQKIATNCLELGDLERETKKANDGNNEAELSGNKFSDSHPSGVPSLYDYLGMGVQSSPAALLQETDDRFKAVAIGSQSAKNNIERTLLAQCKVHFKNEMTKEKYDQALSQLRLEKINNYLKIASASNTIETTVAEKLKKEAMSYGDLRKDEAEQYIISYCKEHNIELLDEKKASSSLAVVKCGFCGVVNEENHKHCSHCGSHLAITCPKCETINSSEQTACHECGFVLNDIINIDYKLRLAKINWDREQYDEAKRLSEQVLRWLPNHELARNILAAIKREEEAVEDTIKKIETLIDKKQYYTARKLFLDERKLIHTSESLKNMEKESLQQVHLAENYMNQATQVDDETAKIDYYIKALDTASDCAKAKKMLAKWPPAAPTQLAATTSVDGITLTWQPSSARGSIKYRILRKLHEPSNHIQDGELIAEISDCTYSDTDAIGGFPYFYTIYAVRGSIISRESVHNGPFIHKAEVSNLTIHKREDAVELQWKKPKGALAVEVIRKENDLPENRTDGQSLPNVGTSAVLDSDIVYGKRYGYLVTTVYDLNGERHYSRGLSQKIEVFEQLNKLENILVERKSDGVLISWNAWNDRFGTCEIYYSSTPFSINTGETVPLQNIANLGEKIRVTGGMTSTFIEMNMNKPIYLLPVTSKDEVALIGDLIVSKHHPEVLNVHHNDSNNELLLRWDWPPKVNDVLLTYGAHSFPTNPQDPLATSRTINKGMYDALNGFQLKPEERDYYFTIFTRYEDNNELIHSNGVQYLYVNSDLIDITYDIKVANYFLKRTISVHISVPQAIELPELVLVKRANSVPTYKEQGEVIYRTEKTAVSQTVKFDIDAKHFEKDMFAKLFFDNEQFAQKYRLLTSSGKSSMQLW
ncbi:MAG TPA: zinc ribbon domain-containing protein [Pseudogracilibacillus sp.]|nr:zinc ribbon domain-containing protein [Pseudogracilibacillus sp.]